VILSVVGDLSVHATGTGLASFTEAFQDDQVQFGCIKVMGVDEQENVTSKRPKYVQINWVGTKVPAMKKMGALAYKDKVADVFKGVGVRIDVAGAKTLDLLSMRNIGVELLRCGGAHKPTKYDFGDEAIPVDEVVQKAD